MAGVLLAAGLNHRVAPVDGWKIVLPLIIVAVAIPMIHVVFPTPEPPPPGALDVTVAAHQWWWEVRYPSLGVVTANELHLPAGRQVVIRVQGADVMHSLLVPRLRGKRDMLLVNRGPALVTAEAPGEYWGQCAEFCGISHENMRLRVLVDTPAGFVRWVERQRAPSAAPAGLAADGQYLFSRSACVGCHTIGGVSTGLVGPDLTHFASRTTFASGMFMNTVDNVARWVRDPRAMKPGAKMPNLGLTADQAETVAAYLESLT
jgi:cytochrome c oxidase subunit 2